jgi:hypothetical protein
MSMGDSQVRALSGKAVGMSAVITALAVVALSSLPAHAQKGQNSGSTHGAVNSNLDLSGVWILSGSALLPSDPSYRPEALKLYNERKSGGGKDDPEKFCLPDGVVRVTSLPYKIVQTPKLVLLLSEGNTHSYRRIFLDGRPHNLDVEPTRWNGDSIGHWEDNSLVVDTIGFNDKSWLDSTGKPHSEALHVIERFRRPDPGHLNVEYTLEDPQAFTKPYSFTRKFTLVTDRDLREYFCAGDRFVGK